MRILILSLITHIYAFASVINSDASDRYHASISSSNLSCYTCSTIDDIKCKVLNETNNNYITDMYSTSDDRIYRSECKPKDRFCAVLRLDAKIEQPDRTAVDYKFWAIERKCADDCVDGCFVLGERTKLSLCTTCCTTDYCNDGNYGNSSVNFNKFLFVIFLIISVIIQKRLSFN